MRAIIGLVALLVGVGVLVMLYAWNAKSLVGRGSAGRQAQEQVAGIGLQTVEGTRYTDTVTLTGDYQGGKLSALLVSTIDAAGPIASKLGLQKGDRILEVGTQGGLQKVRDVGDEELARSYVIEAPRGRFPIVVQRGAQVITLPAGAIQPAPPAPLAQTPAPTPADDTGLTAAAPADDTGLDSSAPPTDAAANAEPTQPKPAAKQRPKNAFGHALELRDKISAGQGQQAE